MNCSGLHDKPMRTLAFAFAAVLAALPARACETALVLTVDVSNSVDTAEWRLQADGIADALRDPEIVAALIETRTALAVVQWSGEADQVLSIPWTRMTSGLDTEWFSTQARRMERAFVLSDTAPAEAIYFSLGLFDAVPDCRRKVIDVSGDGTPNGGSDVVDARAAAERAGVTINAIAIESMGLAITGFFRGRVITRNGFVITARTHRDYPAAIRAKILREISKIVG